MKWQYVAAWFPGVFIAILNGTLRQFVFLQFLPELQAHQLSTLTFIVFFTVYVWFVLGWLKLLSTREALGVGFIWLSITVAFEFLFGHFVIGHPWDRLLHDYDILEGRLWVIVLAWTTFSPWVLFAFRRTSRPIQS